MASTAELICVAPEDVEKMWPFVEDKLRRAISATDLTDFDSIEAGLFTGAFLLWFAWSDHIEAVAVTQLVKAENSKACVIVACSGHERERWLNLRSGIEDYARAEGCKCVRLYGRKGWERVLKDYRAEYVIMEKAI